MIPSDKEIEEWRLAPGFPGYMVSSMGRIKSIERMVWNGRVMRVHREKILTQRPCREGYAIASVYVLGKKKFPRVHRLVALAFLGQSDKPQVNHKNSDRMDARLNNLEWVTQEENMAHMVLSGRSPRGEKNYSAKLDWASALVIKTLTNHPKYKSRAMGKFYGVSHTTVNNIRTGLGWKHI